MFISQSFCTLPTAKSLSSLQSSCQIFHLSPDTFFSAIVYLNICRIVRLLHSFHILFILEFVFLHKEHCNSAIFTFYIQFNKIYLPQVDTKFPVCCGKHRAVLQNLFQVSTECVRACQCKV